MTEVSFSARAQITLGIGCPRTSHFMKMLRPWSTSVSFGFDTIVGGTKKISTFELKTGLIKNTKLKKQKWRNFDVV